MKTLTYILTILLLSPLAQADDGVSQYQSLRAPACVKPAPLVSNEDIQNMIPTDMVSTNDGSVVSKAIARRSVRKSLRTALTKNTSLGKTVERAQNSLKTNVALKTNDINHKINMRVKAFQSEALIKYSGLFNAEVIYNALDDNLDIQMNQNLGGTTNLQVRHKTKEKISSVNLSWAW